MCPRQNNNLKPYIPNVASLQNLCNFGPGSRSLLDLRGVAGPDRELRLYELGAGCVGMDAIICLISGDSVFVFPRRSMIIIMIIMTMISIEVQII